MPFRIYLIGFIFLLYSHNSIGQELHHEMISSQGASIQMNNGLQINQTIGQQSSIGVFVDESMVIQQGYQQVYWNTIITESTTEDIVKEANTVAYPNPFINTINFIIPSSELKNIKVSIFDISGRLVFADMKIIDSNLLSLELGSLAVGEYLILLKGNSYEYVTKIIKQ